MHPVETRRASHLPKLKERLGSAVRPSDESENQSRCATREAKRLDYGITEARLGRNRS